jgi:hypothetical protein
MGISVLQREALGRASQFVEQVNGIVVQQALYQFEQNPDMEEIERQALNQVVRVPSNYGFVQTILCDAGWTLTYDQWAADPPGSEGAILAGVQKAWPLLVGDYV